MPARKLASPKPLSEVVTEGDHRRSLEALRDLLASEMIGANPNVIPQFAGRLQDVLRELAGLPSGEEKSTSDDLARRRKDKLAATVAPRADRRGGKSRAGGD